MVAVVNFPPRQIGPFLSEVLVLGALDADEGVVLLGPTATPRPGRGSAESRGLRPGLAADPQQPRGWRRRAAPGSARRANRRSAPRPGRRPAPRGGAGSGSAPSRCGYGRPWKSASPGPPAAPAPRSAEDRAGRRAGSRTWPALARRSSRRPAAYAGREWCWWPGSRSALGLVVVGEVGLDGLAPPPALVGDVLELGLRRAPASPR